MAPRTLYDDFYDSRRAKNCSENTVTWYKYHFKRLDVWLAGRRVEEFTALDFERFKAWLRANGYSASTVAQAHGALVTFFKWAVTMEIVEKDPTIKSERPKVPDYIPDVVARDYVRHMIERIELNTWIDHRDRTMIELLFCTGIRAGECASLRVEDVRTEPRWLSVVRKGGNQRLIPYPEELRVPLWQWINVHRPQTKLPYLFLTSNRSGGVRGGMNSQSVYWIFKRRATEAAMDLAMSPHAYRHGFAVDMLRNGASTRLVQVLLGHSDIKTTERYLTLMPDLVQEMFDGIWDSHPLKGG